MRTLSELRDEAELMGFSLIDISNLTRAGLASLLANTIAKERESESKYPRAEQIPVQLAKNFRNLREQDKLIVTNNDNNVFIAEYKLDETRVKVHFGDKLNRVTSRHRSDVDYSFVDYTDHFPQIRDHIVPSLVGSILDCGMQAPQETSSLTKIIKTDKLTSSVGLLNLLPENAIKWQELNGYATFFIYDLLFYLGKDIRNDVYKERLIKLNDIDVVPYVNRIPQFTYRGEQELENLFNNSIKLGYEGLVLKHLEAPYTLLEEYRSSAWIKYKKQITLDTFIIGFTPGEKSLEGLVGSLELGVYNMGSIINIGSVSGLTLEERRELTKPDSNGELKEEYVNRVVEVSGQEFTGRNEKIRHCVLVRFRNDKTKEQCTLGAVLAEQKREKRRYTNGNH